MSQDNHHGKRGFHGPLAWIAAGLAGGLVGVMVALIAPAQLGAPGEHGAPVAPGIESPGDAAPEAELGVSDAPPAEPSGHTPPGVTHESQSTDHASAPAPAHADAEHPAPLIPLWLCAPFVVMLLSIALMPFINEHVWELHFPDFAFALAGVVVAYYLMAFGDFGRHSLLHVGREYYAFLGLIGSLFVVSGGILIDVRAKARPGVNVMLLAAGAVLANIVGTTGASVLLIRPFMRINRERLHPLHVVFFIFIVSNCGGCLTPIGDPPLYLGFLRGVPFFWTLTHLWMEWATCIGLLLGAFYVVDSALAKRQDDSPVALLLPEVERVPGGPPVQIQGLGAIVMLGLVVGLVFLDPLLAQLARGPAPWLAQLDGIPIGPTLQILTAVVAYRLASERIHKANGFTLFPVKEVGFLFVGIFATMAPALAYLETHGADLPLHTPGAFYFGTGALSGFLDNAPTYLNFLQAAFGARGLPLTPDNVHHFLDPAVTPDGIPTLAAISLGSVFFGAMTYIGNGPNFMVKSIAEASGLKMPSFFGYVRYSLLILTPILVLIWAIFIR